MATIREITDLRLPSSTARAHWNGFVNETITSSQPGEQWTPFRWRRIERDSDRDVVQFEQTAPGMTRMTVELDEPGEAADSPTSPRCVVRYAATWSGSAKAVSARCGARRRGEVARGCDRGARRR